ncbi:hypothetical protein JIN77_01320 [Verrucomicrobiaceae bacterium R5-34]|uniref:histidine kinase n=1 Tax=Oceaniferula flava TaxID=2800421 RepID=A0AAE2S8T6_9BACT|nr:ATP-binding protein [Oceaniferula flavus]MBK1829351.1 hypothetical protein [Verrucomicrobiaceae bacterium R5-34]MBK1853578.1 hypothetical protein [Oceaniferula flavus]MBM1134883.1 hypothetical protein [Oceaniferula flavus]
MTVYLLIAVVVALSAWIFWQQRQNSAKFQVQELRGRELRKEALSERDQLLDALGDAFLLVNETSHITFANASARNLVKGRKLMGRSIMEAFLDDRLSVAVMKCIRTGKPMQELVVLHSSHTPLGSAGEEGGSAWVIDAAPLSSSDDSALTRIVIRDVTAEHQAEQVRRDFVANASHELRTPMAIINGYLENLIDDDVVEDPVTSRKFLKTMRKHGARISRLVEDMLVISKMESGEAMTLNKNSFSLRACAMDVVERLEHMTSKQEAEIILDMEPSDLRVTGDRFYWTQIIFNLVENALKQNPAPGLKITVKGTLNEDESICIAICDDGIGIPSADLPFIFRRFYRVDKHHTQSEVKGTGLGLSIVRRAVEAHGGEIKATSTPGSLTCFTISLPPEPEETED